MNHSEEDISVSTKRILYTATSFAKKSLLHVQEVGSLKAIAPHTSKRNGLQSYLFFVVKEGSGSLVYENVEYVLHVGDCVFIDCRKPYEHSTSEDLWALDWCHFNGWNMEQIYQKYMDRGGKIIFHPKDISVFQNVLKELYMICSSSENVRDMYINEKLSFLLTQLMKVAWHEDAIESVKKANYVHQVKEYIDAHYVNMVSLDELAHMFFIDKYYLTKVFKEAYGVTINTYVMNCKITASKQYLRFSDLSLEDISHKIGMHSANYFCRAFKKIEGITPGEYRKDW